MKKLYIQPATMIQTMNFINSVCVGSFHGDADLDYGGEDTSGSVDPL